MLFQTSYSSKETEQAITNLVGKPIGFIKNIKMGGIGSQRLLVNEANEEIQKLLKKQNTPPHTNIELRPKGILLRFRVKLDNWSLALSYSKLDIIQNANHLLLVVDEWELQLTPSHNDVLDPKFVQKLLKLKSEFIAECDLKVEKD